MEKPGMVTGRKLYRVRLLIFIIFLICSVPLSAQSNWPMAIETPRSETQINEILPEPQQIIITPLLFWETVPQITALSLAAGERITLILRGWFSPQPQPEFFVPEAPMGVILSAQPITAAERQSGIVMKLLLIPLAPGDFHLPARVLQYENTRFEIPALQIRITERH